jgi:hypothetical protein
VLNIIFKILSLNFLNGFNLEFEFFQTNSSKLTIPFELAFRNQNIMWVALIGLLLSVAVLAFSRFGSSNYILVFSKVLLKNNSINKIIQDEYSLSSLGSVLLIFNYFISFSTLIYLSFSRFIDINNFEIIIISSIPIYLFLWPLFCFNLLGFLTNEHSVFSENKKNTIVISQVLGVIFSLILLLWTFNLKWSSYFISAFLISFVLFWLYKFFRGIIFSIQHNISWYYIILYFCTLELIPVLIFYLYFFENLF